jgi:hypothetical protein
MLPLSSKERILAGGVLDGKGFWVILGAACTFARCPNGLGWVGPPLSMGARGGAEGSRGLAYFEVAKGHELVPLCALAHW